MYQISQTFHVKYLGRKARKLVSRCYICQRVKHSNIRFETGSRSHTPKSVGELLAMDLYGQMPTGRGGFCYFLVCLDVFTKFVKLYALRTATAKACL